ncbi:NAD-glutamate dehydrogenase domain-containing protein [Candidatus Protochlamydia phocaeensis]|uniref:NAD-glutamate dehydrogenase domain-containing protein n=1 Tax=Candidatus Protochlamydia phocaeensis TaxID=1414722 RepID=UPI000839434A|nr:NAD-glutamate dehydrogenase domain-containing protein [Candidatus Protochlamydia phocaeensis]
MEKSDYLPSSNLSQAIQQESEKFQEYYLWLEAAMPATFFEEVSRDNLMLITHSLMGFDLQDYFSMINLKSAAIALCLDSPDADLRILRNYTLYGIKNYQSYVSKIPFPGTNSLLRVATIDFTGAIETTDHSFLEEWRSSLRTLVKQENPDITDQDFEQLLPKMSSMFLHSLPPERLAIALNMLYRAQTRDNCQYEARYEENWNEKDSASMHIMLAWRNTPKHNFLYRLAQVVHRHGLSMRRVNATYMDPYSKQSVLVMALSLHGSNGQPVWDVADIPDFLREMATIKYFETGDRIDERLVNPRIISGNMGNLLRAMVNFIHQALVHIDSNLYTVENIEEALCRHPELTLQLCEAFRFKFDPHNHNIDRFIEARKRFLNDVSQLDTGQESNDTRRKNVLRQGMNFVSHTLKTNFYRLNYTALSFRLDPKYLDEIPFDRSKKFPEIPYAIFYMRGMHFFGFHIRFKDLARGGLRTVYPEQLEQMLAERNNVFTECYNLAWTQHKKNKDIPEGGAKAVLFLKPFDQIDSESQILKRELEWLRLEPQEVEQRVRHFRQEQKVEYLYQSQRAFIQSLITIVNCDPDGKIRARYIIDYWKKPEYIYLGPDENMHDFMIQWIANFSKRYDYKPKGAFISSKPVTGINHKEYGVTSLGVNVYMHQVLEYMGIHPEKDVFTVKMSGGPDGDVAGNQLLNLYHFYPHTAKLIALTDGTGTIRDEQGLDLGIIKDLFYQGKGICFYPPDKLSPGSFLVNKGRKRYPSAYIQETLCWRKSEGKVVEDWLSGSDTNHLLRYNLHQAKTDIFIPAGGRPRTLNETNIQEFLDETGKPTSRAIIEGANLYLNPAARKYLEEKGVLIVKDSSANKGGVICSSFEVLCGLALDDETFIEHKAILVKEILERIKLCALNEADLLLRTHKQTGEFLTDISEKISARINQYTYQLLDYLDLLPLPSSFQDPMIRSFLNYCLPTLRNQFAVELLNEIPEHHKKAIIACHLASYMVYKKGLDWSPSIVDILPLILSGTALTS